MSDSLPNELCCDDSRDDLTNDLCDESPWTFKPKVKPWDGRVLIKEKMLGKGAFAAVYLVHDEASGLHMAWKKSTSFTFTMRCARPDSCAKSRFTASRCHYFIKKRGKILVTAYITAGPFSSSGVADGLVRPINVGNFRHKRVDQKCTYRQEDLGNSESRGPVP